MTHGSDTSALSRRAMLAGLAATPALGATVVSAGAQTATMTASGQAKAALKDAKGTKLVILGTAAGPVPGRPRKMTSHVMLSNGAAYVLDCGLGVTDRYAETGIPFGALRSIFITHHHFDHNVEYGPLLVDRLGARHAAHRKDLRSAAAQTDDRRLHSFHENDNRLLGGRFEDEAA